LSRASTELNKTTMIDDDDDDSPTKNITVIRSNNSRVFESQVSPTRVNTSLAKHTFLHIVCITDIFTQLSLF